jgi:hypothetical protein
MAFYVVVPMIPNFNGVQPFIFPALLETPMDQVNNLNQERARAYSRVEDLNEGCVRRDARRNAYISVTTRDFTPGCGVGQPVLEAETGSKQLVYGPDNVRNDWARGIEDPSFHLLLSVVFAKKQLIEVKDWVFERVLITKIANYSIDVRVVE